MSSSVTPSPWLTSAYRIGRYTLLRAVTLLATVAATVYLTIVIANFGGQIDDFIRADIDFAIGMSMRGMEDVTAEEKQAIFEERRDAAYEAAGLNTPFLVRCFRWLWRGLTLNWGETRLSPTGSWYGREREIRSVISESLPRTLLIFGASNLLLFVVTVVAALPLTSFRFRWLDRLIMALSTLSAAPAWVYGILLNVLALNTLGGILSGGAFDAWPDELRLAYVPLLLRHLVLPLLAIFLSGLFQGIYTWRTYFQLHADEDYVELARAKGLSRRRLQRRYILRPMLPSLLTSFALLFVNLWQEIIILERNFNITGIGELFARVVTWNAPGRTPFIVALVVTFAYLLAVTVFVLDLAYAIADPRIRISGLGATVRARNARPRARARRRQRHNRQRRRQRPAARTARRANDPISPTSARAERSAPVTQRGTRGASRLRRRLNQALERLAQMVGQLVRYPAAVFGLLIIAGLIVISIYTVIAIPYDEMVVQWRDGEESWAENPRNALPTWLNRFSKRAYPETIIIDSRSVEEEDSAVTRAVEVVSEDMTEISLTFPFNYAYDAPPQDMAVFIDTTYDDKRPLVTLNWLRPDGIEIQLMSRSLGSGTVYRLSQDDKLPRKLGTDDLLAALFNDPFAYLPIIEHGQYQLQVRAYVFEEDATVEAKMVLYGQVFGLAGTDPRRRDLSVPLLWGMSIALAFGLVAAISTTVSSVMIAAVGTWLGGWVDVLVQRITEVNMILPFLPVSIMVYVLYSKSIWVILGVTVLLSIFSSSIKNYRTLFLQVRESPYVEAAKCYGAGTARIISHYLIPRIITVLIPQVVILVPSYVFLEASLAVLGVSDPVLPTWGKLIAGGLEYGLHSGNYHLILQPLGLLMLVGIAFVLLGISLERVLRPTIRFT